MATESSRLIVGRIPFLVCTPFFHLDLQEAPAQVTFVDGVPSAHNANLAQALVHMAPSSSYEYAKHGELYSILPEICTGSTLEIRSVTLFSNVPLGNLHQKKIHLTGQSATSVHLLKLLLEVWKGVSPIWCEGEVPEDFSARLLIGDEALAEAHAGSFPYSYDLATLWQEWQGLPFVFGMWIIHRSVFADVHLSEILSEYRKHLVTSVNAFRANPAEALQHWFSVYPSKLPLAFLLRYYAIVDYQFTAEHRESLAIFYDLCAQAKLIEKAPVLRWA